MATSTARASRAKVEKPAESTPTFTVKASPVTKFRTGTTKPNPLSGAVAATKDSGEAAMIEVANQRQAVEVQGYLRRDANDNNSGVRILFTDGDGNVIKSLKGDAGENVRQVHFQHKPRSKRQYTTADIKAWYATAYGEPLNGKVTTAIREEFRKANGYTKEKDAE